jgi:Tetratricopeptide repeat
MNVVDTEIAELRSEVERNPNDSFLRCNLAQLLASVGDHQAAMLHLGAAMQHARGPVAAGCVVAAIRNVTDDYARLWQLPAPSPDVALLSA